VSGDLLSAFCFLLSTFCFSTFCFLLSTFEDEEEPPGGPWSVVGGPWSVGARERCAIFGRRVPTGDNRRGADECDRLRARFFLNRNVLQARNRGRLPPRANRVVPARSAVFLSLSGLRGSSSVLTASQLCTRMSPDAERVADRLLFIGGYKRDLCVQRCHCQSTRADGRSK